MKNLGAMMKQVQEMQSKMQDMQANLERLTVTGQSGAGLVTLYAPRDVADVLLQLVEPAAAADREANDIEPVVMHKGCKFLMRGEGAGAQVPARPPEEFRDHR